MENDQLSNLNSAQQNTNDSQMNKISQTVVNQKPPHKFPILKYVLIGVIAVLIVAGLAGAYALGAQKTDNSSAAISSTPTNTVDLMADWKTYENTKRGYSFKYDPKFSVVSVEETQANLEHVAINIAPVEYVKGAGNGETLSKGSHALFTIYKEKDISDSKLIEEYGDNIEIDVKNIGGKAFKSIKLSGENHANIYYHKIGPEVLALEVWVGFNNTPEEKENYIYQFDQILSTFKFTDSTSQPSNTSDWKTFSNKEITFMYPSDYSYYSCSENNEGIISIGLDLTSNVENNTAFCGIGGKNKFIFDVIGIDKTIENYLNTIPLGVDDKITKIKYEKIGNLETGYVIRTSSDGKNIQSFHAFQNPISKKLYTGSVFNKYDSESRRMLSEIISTVKFN